MFSRLLRNLIVATLLSVHTCLYLSSAQNAPTHTAAEPKAFRFFVPHLRRQPQVIVFKPQPLLTTGNQAQLLAARNWRAASSVQADPCSGQLCNYHGECRADEKEINGYICLCDWHWSGRDCQVEGPGTFWPVFIASLSTVGSFALIVLLVTAR
eukprot:Gregarina_sp_Pseudo_9__771@NODE_1495_length_1547_cov_28_313660_g1385_i0_p1_GENE_NODE_1495_length_1547_cov_28_313660_g1385_i0NODE_1495_length_1547_cov_28_313660_g1385_i0_p1_ORF_typecomplete_len154_score12_38DUF3844/PF12955_7/0_0022EGF_2/PF07974_13/0_039EGF/PF00008_27/0_061EGF_Tenascin/PF18720_1/0_073Laminin_EGF/PF00053_24/0_32EGF_alliinase/PF04863_13/0_9_NODE_1495_length_1547_cov_28_313660_g1385_i07191180